MQAFFGDNMLKAEHRSRGEVCESLECRDSWVIRLDWVPALGRYAIFRVHVEIECDLLLLRSSGVVVREKSEDIRLAC
jgi:hypothetical protein